LLAGNDGDADLLLGYAMDLDTALLYEEAAKAYSRVLAMDPGRIEALFNRGLDYFYLSRYEEALPDFETYLGLVPDDAFALKYLAISCMETGRVEKGRDLMERARSIDPGIDQK
jgi:tetratricopeptide (TPR) repeat protein